MSAKKSIAVIAMSVRRPRVGLHVAANVHAVVSKAAGDEFAVKLVDLADFKLPVYDEELTPAMVTDPQAQYQHEHTRRWSAEIASHDAYVLVLPEYNYSIAGGAKNAIDYLYNEWIGKPIVAVTYGIYGGHHVSAAAKQILEGMKLRLAPTRPSLGFVGNVAGKDFMLAAQGQLGEETKSFILEGDGSKEITKSFAELKDLLATPVEATK
ncbi:hypothetical protein PspLS_02251 [Pyricularia sp. CBS 133598]|nr:hypothetical protein PspLS_02251 [Pyricularia sp. CBS 133598]